MNEDKVIEEDLNQELRQEELTATFDKPLFMSRVRKLRAIKGWSQAAIAKKLGIGRQTTYSNWENGSRKVPIHQLIKLAELFEVTPDYLMGISDSPTGILTQEERTFMYDLELSDAQLLHKYAFTLDGKPLSDNEAQEIIFYIRTRRQFSSSQSV